MTLNTIESAIVLAAGRGSRLKWLSKDQAKPMVKVQGEAAIVHILRRLRSQGIRQVIINTHYHGDALQRFLGRGESLGVDIQYSTETSLLDSGGGVATAMRYLSSERPFLVHNSDVLSNIDVQALYPSDDGWQGVLALTQNPRHHPEGDFSIVQACVQAKAGNTTTSYTFCGVSLWKPMAFQGLAKQKAFSLLQVMHAVMKKQQLRAYQHTGQWLDIGRPRDVWRARYQTRLED